jgi:hypothetical protein
VVRRHAVGERRHLVDDVFLDAGLGPDPPVWPNAGSQKYHAFGFIAFTVRTISTVARACAGEPTKPDSTASQRFRPPIAATPSTSCSIFAASIALPAQCPYCMWLDSWTVLSGQTLTPSRCIGNTAALLPACP